MKANITLFREFYEIKNPNDIYGLCGIYESAEKALAEINRSYVYAKAKGYDNKQEKYIIVCNQTKKEVDKQGMFLKEEISRFVVESVEYSESEKSFVFVY